MAYFQVDIRVGQDRVGIAGAQQGFAVVAALIGNPGDGDCSIQVVDMPDQAVVRGDRIALNINHAAGVRGVACAGHIAIHSTAWAPHAARWTAHASAGAAPRRFAHALGWVHTELGPSAGTVFRKA